MSDATSEPVGLAASDPSGPENGPQIDAAAPEDVAVGDDTGAAWSDAFAPPGGDGEPSAEDYQSAIRTMGLEDNGSDDADLVDNINEVDPASSDTDDDTEIPSGNAEAARYRHRLRDAKHELAATQDRLDALQQRVDVMHRAEAERVAGSSLIEPGDLWRDGAQLDDIRNPDGDIDENAVHRLAAAVIKAHPHAARASRSPFGRFGSGASAPPAEELSPAWSQAFAPRREG